MKQLIIENILQIEVYIRIKITLRKNEETKQDIIEVKLYFESPEYEETELQIKKIESMQQLTLDLPDNLLIEVDFDNLIPYVNFETAEDEYLLLIRLASLKPAQN